MDDEHREMIDLINATYEKLDSNADADEVEEYLGEILSTISMHMIRPVVRIGWNRVCPTGLRSIFQLSTLGCTGSWEPDSAGRADFSTFCPNTLTAINCRLD